MNVSLLKAKEWAKALPARIALACGVSPSGLLRLGRVAEASLRASVSAMRKSDPRGNPSRLRLVFFTVLGSHSYMLGSEFALALAMRRRGHEVHLVLCDGVLPACENKSVDNPERWHDVCARCAYRGRAMAEASGLNVHFLSELQKLEPAEEASLASENFDHTIQSSLYKHFRVGRLSGSPDETDQSRRVSQACQVTARAALSLARLRPDRVVMSHGVYSSWAPALQVFCRLGIPVAVYNKGKKRNSTVMNWISGAMDWDVSREWAKVGDKPLTPTQRRRINDYLESRKTHKADALRYNFGEVEGRDIVMRRMGLDPAKPVVVLFTNVLWDAASAQKEIAFPNAVDWVMETIEWFSRHPEKQLVVKIHPAEVVIGTKQPFVREISRVFPRLPSNVFVIPPETVTNSWSIADVADLGLVHTSTPGMELPIEGKPCVVVSNVHYRGKGFTLDIGSKAEYFALLERWPDVPFDREVSRELALRYAYLLFERYHLDWGFMLESSYGRYVALDARSDNDLLAHSTVAMICDALENRTDFLHTLVER